MQGCRHVPSLHINGTAGPWEPVLGMRSIGSRKGHRNSLPIPWKTAQHWSGIPSLCTCGFQENIFSVFICVRMFTA